MKIVDLNPTPLMEIPCVNVAPGGGRVERRLIPVLHGRVSGLPPAVEGLILTADLQGFAEDALSAPISERIFLSHVIAKQLGQLLGRAGLPAAAKTIGLLCGDFYAIPELNKRGGLGDVEAFWRAFRAEVSTVVGVAGNHDRFNGRCTVEGAFDPAEKIYALDGDVVAVQGLTIGGVSGVLGLVSQRPWHHSPVTFLQKGKAVLRARPDILLLHEGPSLTLSHSKGSLIVRQLLGTAKQELLVACGHRHWPEPLLELSPQVQVVNVDSRVLILSKAK